MLVFEVICVCECVLFVVVGEVIVEQYFNLNDSQFDNKFIDMFFDVFLGKLFKMYCDVSLIKVSLLVLDEVGIILSDVVNCILFLFIVVEKIFFIIIGDCLVIGFVSCD